MIEKLIASEHTKDDVRQVLIAQGKILGSEKAYADALAGVQADADENLRPFLLLANRELYRRAMECKDFASAQKALAALQKLSDGD